MISSYLGYQLYGNKLTQTLQRTAAEPVVARGQAYYNAQIGSIKSVGDLVGNYRLLSYATKAFGLSDVTYAKALLTKVLESDLSDPTSVANKLGGNYLAFAKAFSFNTDGSVKTSTQLQNAQQQASTESLFSANTSLDATTAAAATKAYQTTTASLTSLDQVEGSQAALGYVLIAYGINASTASATFEQTLESDLANPDSYLNKQANSGYLALSQAFDVDSSGTATTVTQAVSDTSLESITQNYLVNAGNTATAQTAAASATSDFLSAIGKIGSASDLTNNPQLVTYLKTAFQLPASATAVSVLNALTSDLSQGSSFANSSSSPGYLALAKAFNFKPSGELGTITQLQTSTQQQQTISLYTARQKTDSADAAAATAYYKANIGKITSLTALEADPKLLAYVETAYGITAATTSATLTSVIENKNGINTTSGNASLLALRLAFNVDRAGAVTTPLTAQSPSAVAATTSAYIAAAKTDDASQAAAKAATAYYKAAITKVTSVSSLLADPKLVAYLEQAYAIPTNTTPDTLRAVLTSDVGNQKSAANTAGAAFATLAAAFNFAGTGLVAPVAVGPQSKAQLHAVNSAYLQQQIETEAGQQNPGTQLALYFAFNASKVTGPYDVLADKQLLQVFQVIQGLPSTSTGADIDVQAKSLSAKFDFTKFKDPAYVNTLVQRFSVLYDLNPPASTAPLTTLSLLSNSTGTFDVTSLFAPPNNN